MTNPNVYLITQIDYDVRKMPYEANVLRSSFLGCCLSLQEAETAVAQMRKTSSMYCNGDGREYPQWTITALNVLGKE